VSDEEGLAVSSQYYGLEQDLGCKVTFLAPLQYVFVRQVNVFLPEWVTLTLPDSRVDAVAGMPFGVDVDADMYGDPVNAQPEVVRIGTSPSGATALATGGECWPNSGRCRMTFLAGDRPGLYEVELRYGISSVIVQVLQRPQ
jgi:hypothetical protein